MLRIKTVIFYCIGNDMPQPRHLPHGDTDFNKLYDFNSLEETIINIRDELANLQNSLDKYDHHFEIEHREMCNEMKALQAYLNKSLIALEAVKE